MGSVALGLYQDIKWPNYCAVCDEQPTDWAKTSITETTKIGYYVVALSISHQTYTLAYPVCKKHKALCNFLNLPAQSSIINIVFGSIFATLALWGILALLFYMIFALIGLGTTTKDLIGPWAFVLAIGLVVFYYIYAVFYQPVKILFISEHSIKISIKNEKYFNDFKLANISNVLS